MQMMKSRRFEHRPAQHNDYHDPMTPHEPKDFNDSLDHQDF